MFFSGSDPWSEDDQRVLDELERTWNEPSQPQLTDGFWTSTLLSVALLLADAVLLGVAVRLPSRPLAIIAYLLFPLLMAPSLLHGTAKRP